MGFSIQKEFYVDTFCDCGKDLDGLIDSRGILIVEKCEKCKDENYNKGYADCEKIKVDS